MGKTLYNGDKRLEMLRELMEYPCADARESAEQMIVEEFGKSALNKPGRPRRRNMENSQDSSQSSQDFHAEDYKRIKVPRLWGVQKQHLKRLNKDTLENIFYGSWNLWVPGDMLDLENPFEILANYLAAGILKRYDGHLGREDIPRGHFSDLVKFMNEIAYGYRNFTRALQSFRSSNRFSVNPGDQERRLDSLDGQIKRQFCASFFRKYRASKREEPENPDSFYDPNNKDNYVDRIYEHLAGRFGRERQ